jgi:hypothetical protein
VVAPTFVLVGLALLLSQSQLTAQQNIVQNGDFTSLSVWGWTYNFAVAEGYQNAAVGNSYGQVFGTLFQSLPTTPGQTYQLQFAMAGNLNFPDSAVLDVLWGGASVGSISWSPAGNNRQNLGWVWTDFYVTALTSSTELAFDNPNVGTENIPFLDAVTVEPVPEPSAASLLLLGSGALLYFARFRRA